MYGPAILIETVDAQSLSVGETVTLMEWGNAIVVSITRDKFTVLHPHPLQLDVHGPVWQDLVTQLALRLTLDNKNFKDTKKVTWLADSPAEKSVPVVAQQFTSLITAPNVPKVPSQPMLRACDIHVTGRGPFQVCQLQ